MKNELVNFTSSLLTNFGINILQNNSVNYKICISVITYVLLIMVDISLFMVSITNYHDFNTFVAPAPFIASASVILCGLHVTHRHKKVVSELLYSLDSNLYAYPDEYSFNIHYKWYQHNDIIFTTIYWLFTCQVLFVAMISLSGFVELIYSGQISTFIYPTWCPWKLDNVRVQLFTHLFEICQAAFADWFNQISIIFQLVVVVEFTKQYHRLDTAIKSLESRTLEFLSQHDLDEKQYDRVMRLNIEHCIRHHQMINKSYHLFKIWFEAFFSLELLICLSTFALALYVLINGSNLSQIWNFFIVLLFLWCNFLTRCLISEIFTHLNDHLGRTIFSEIDWLRMNKKNRRLLLMLHQKISSSFPGLHGLSVFEANRATLGKIIRSTYSMFNVLKFSRN